jgi:hypothetical protein
MVEGLTRPLFSCYCKRVNKRENLMTQLQEDMAIQLHHDGGGLAKFSPGPNGMVWYDTYFNGKSFFHSSMKTEMVADVIMALLHSGYYVVA